MRTQSTREPGNNWDISRVDRAVEGPAGVSRWTETYGARVLGLALTKHPEFFDHVREVRADDATALDLARGYIQRDQGRRATLIARYLEVAAWTGPSPNENAARMRVWNIVPTAWMVGGQVSAPSAPQRALRPDAAETIARGALRVARRGGGRCLEPTCCDWTGAKLAVDNTSGYCAAHETDPTRRPRETTEAERSMFNATIPVVLLDEASRPARRRLHRSASLELT